MNLLACWVITQGIEGGKTENPKSWIFFHKSHLYMCGELGFNWFDKVIKKKAQEISSKFGDLVQKDQFPI